VDEQQAHGGGPNEDDERESVYGLLQRGQALIRTRHHAQAAIVLERAALAEPRKGSILEPLGRAYHHSGQFEQARGVFAELLEVDPSLRKLGRIDEARTHARLAVALSPRSELYRRALARLEPPESQPDPDGRAAG